MTLEDFIANFAEQFDETDATEIQADTIFFDLDEWSSLSALSVIAMVDSEYNVNINGKDVRSCETIEDLFNLVKNKANV